MERLTERYVPNNEKKGIVGIKVFESENKTPLVKVLSGEYLYPAIEKLAEYEGLEEQGLLMRLPCKVGDTVWVVTSPINVFNECDGAAEYEVYESYLSSVTYYTCGEQFRINAKVTNSFIVEYFRECDFGKTVFLTREEAEKKLGEMCNE